MAKLKEQTEVKVIEEEADDFTSIWMVPYVNLMTILMIFFLIVYSYSLIMDKKLYEQKLAGMQKEAGGKDMTTELQKILQSEKLGELEKALLEKGLKEFVDVITSEEGMKITMRNPILFGLGEADLAPAAKKVLKEVIGIIKDSDDEIMVEGYTCDKPVGKNLKYKSNWDLSSARAFSVVKYFIENNINPDRLSAIGYGEFRPLYPNDTEDRRALNRRIEINVIHKK